MRAASLLILAPVGGLVALVFVVVLVLGGHSVGSPPATASAGPATGCSAPVPPREGSWHLSGEQWADARTIVFVGRAAGIPPRGWLVAIATALQESGLLPLPYGDRDSLGMFQQRSPWAPAADRVDPVMSTRMFYLGGEGGESGLVDIPGWRNMAVTVAAQAVQQSAYPDAYARWVPVATRIVDVVGHTHVSGACRRQSAQPVKRAANATATEAQRRPVRAAPGKSHLPAGAKPQHRTTTHK